MITIRNRQHLARLLKHLRETAGMSRRDLAQRLFVSTATIANRDQRVSRWDVDSTIDVAHMHGLELALVPARHPGARPTGTGWPT